MKLLAECGGVTLHECASGWKVRRVLHNRTRHNRLVYDMHLAWRLFAVESQYQGLLNRELFDGAVIDSKHQPPGRVIAVCGRTAMLVDNDDWHVVSGIRWAKNLTRMLAADRFGVFCRLQYECNLEKS